MKREVKFLAGYNCIDFPCKFKKKCSKDNSHGVHGMDILFLVHGKKGAVQFKFSTGYVPYYMKPDNISYRETPNYKHMEYYPSPTDLGYHSYKPIYKGQTSMSKCDVLNGKECYYDGSGLNASDAFYTLINGGEEALWKFLEQYYKYTFSKGKYPNVIEYGTN